MSHRSPDARAEVLAAARMSARRRGDSRVGTDHLLIGVVSAGNDIAQAAGLSVERLHEALDRLDGSALGAFGIDAAPETLTSPSQIERCRPTHKRLHRAILNRHLPLSAGAKRSLEKSARLALDHHQRHISTNHLLAALSTGGHNDPAVHLLRSFEIDPADLESAVRATLNGL
ncbi:MAG: Clp protease N-terminal domain-containing protein [Acidimicrobiia bacterium]